MCTPALCRQEPLNPSVMSGWILSVLSMALRAYVPHKHSLSLPLLASSCPESPGWPSLCSPAARSLTNN